jgi:hypothetical protein
VANSFSMFYRELKVQALNRLRYIFGGCDLAFKGGNTMCNIKNRSAMKVLNNEMFKLVI